MAEELGRVASPWHFRVETRQVSHSAVGRPLSHLTSFPASILGPVCTAITGSYPKMGRLQQVYHFLKRNRRAIGLIAGASAAGFAAWRIKRVLDDYKRIIREHDLARLDQHRYVAHLGEILVVWVREKAHQTQTDFLHCLIDKPINRSLQMHMLRSRGECVPALLNFMQTLRKRVYEIVDVTSPVKALKAGRGGLSKQEEQALWHQVKVSGFSRFFLAYYGFNLLNVMLRVQVHILGRYAFEASRQEMLQAAQRDQEEGQGPRGEFCSLGDAGYAATGSSSFGSDDRCRLLSLVYEHFLGEGLRRLKEAVEVAVREELGAWSVHAKIHVDYAELHDALMRIRRRLEGPRGVLLAESPLLQYVLDAASQAEDLGPPGSRLHEMVNETWDAFESPSFKLAVEDCLDVTFRVFLEDLFRSLYASPPSASRSARPGADEKERPLGEGIGKGPVAERSTEEEGSEEARDSDADRAGAEESKPLDPPLAKLIPHMKNAATKVFNGDPQNNEYIRITAQNRSVNLLCSSFFTIETSFD